MLLEQNVEQCLLGAFRSVLGDDMLRGIFDNIETTLKLEPGKLVASRHVLREYGNMSGATIIFVLDELHRPRKEEAGHHQLPEWEALLAFRPGITVETIVMRPHAASMNIDYYNRLKFVLVVFQKSKVHHQSSKYSI